MNETENQTKTIGKEKIKSKRRYLPAEKKYQLFIEAERGGQPLGGLSHFFKALIHENPKKH